MHSQIEKNLIVFLDLGEKTSTDQWFFADIKNLSYPVLQRLLIEEKICVVHFNRRNFWRCILLWGRYRFRKNFLVRLIFYKNDGLLSSFFAAEDSAVYPAFRKAHLPQPRGLKSIFISYVPLAIQTDECFLLIAQRKVFDDSLRSELTPELRQLNFMFFSNADGKLLLMNCQSFHTGSCFIAKTTTNQQYREVMAEEFETLQHIFEHTGRCNITPEPIKRIHGKNRDYFLENYIVGRSLREILRDPQVCANQFSVCTLIDRLDDWFVRYSKGFKGQAKPFQDLYLPLFSTLRLVFFDNLELSFLVEKNWQALILLDQKHPGLTPIIAHNDLWPGNFIMASDRLVAVDWERATSERSELFDYFWMIISAVMEYRVGVTGVQDYATGFRSCLYDDDIVCRHARDKILSRMTHNDIPQDLSNLFYALFLMEWSVQGWLVFKRQTDMDKLAVGELLNFSTYK